jgi:hypothetical protein
MLTILYLISFLDRSNIGMSFAMLCGFRRLLMQVFAGNAKIEGLDTDLQLDGVKYNVALCIFFIPYILLGGFS